MNPKEIPFTDAYVKEQQSKSSLGYKLGATLAFLCLAVGIFSFVNDHLVPGLIFVNLSTIYVVWGSLAKLRMNTFRENLELSRMIQQLREDK